MNQARLAARMEASRLFWEEKKAERRRAHAEQVNKSGAALLLAIAGAIGVIEMLWRYAA